MARGKYSKRGGGSRFAATSAEEIEQRNARMAELDEARAKRREEAAEEGDGEGKEADQKDDASPEAVGARVASLTAGNGEDFGGGGGETRREREERQKAEAAAAYRKKHEAGLTEEYKRDMEKLAEVKKRREAAAAKVHAEEEEAKAQEEDRKSKAKAAEQDSEKKKKPGIPKLDKIAIKKMKPAQLKDALKERGLDIQGNAKTLIDRLLKHEAER